MTRSRSLLPAVLLIGALLLAACGDDTGTGGGGSSSGGAGSGVDLKGVSLAVGSKEFTEQRVLGQIVVQALKGAGADVQDKTCLLYTSPSPRDS